MVDIKIDIQQVQTKHHPNYKLLTIKMLSRQLFQDGGFDETQHAQSYFDLQLTPSKEENVFSFLTPNVKRSNLFLGDDDEDSGFGGETPPCKIEPSLKRKRKDIDTNTALSKRCRQSDELKDVVNRLSENGDLIADGSRSHSLPTITGKHQDMKSISSQTLADLIGGCYDDVIDSYRIIDCRYPYEFEGGHIKGAENKYLHENVLSLLERPTTEKEILVFHCEFSSERGPKMLRFLRSKDRELNKENYPALNFPEIYLLDGGYKSFFNEHPTLCDPISYRPMLHSDHSADLRHFRAKSKSWTAGEKRRQARRAIRM